MSMLSDPQASALLAHVVSQMQHNVDFLVSQNYISSEDASAFMSKLPSNNNANQLGPRLPVLPTNAPPAHRGIPPPIGPRTVQARALWAYNENGGDPDDLSFSAGEIIDIVAETNDDWWMGKVRGKQALFPSSYVEKIDATATSQSTLVNNPGTSSQVNAKPVYKPFMAARHGEDAPPASGVNSVGLQQDAGQAQKKNKFGKYGNTMAHSAAGGVGFGAGAAIGGGLVRAIF